MTNGTHQGPARSARRAGARAILPALVAIAGLTLTAAPLLAQPAPAVVDTLPRYLLEAVTATVTRDTVARGALPRQIDVVTRRDIERTAAADVAQLLKKQATADVIEFPGLLAGIGLRGFRPQFSGITQRTLVLIDGRPAGASNLALLSLHAVDRVEVLRGPASSLYGSSAMGGVVNVVTSRSAGPIRSTATLGYGSWDSREAAMTAGGDLAAGLDFDLGLAAFERGRDYRVGSGNLFRDWLGDSVAVRVFPDSVSLSRELGSGEVRPHTRYGTRSGTARLGYRLADDWRLDARAEALRAERVETPGDLFYEWGDDRSLKNVARSSTDLALAGRLGGHALMLRGFLARETGENFNRPDSGPEEPQFVGLRTWNRWHGVQLQDVLGIGAHTLIAGLDFTRAQADSERFGAPGERVAPWEPDSRITSRAAFAEARLRGLDDRLVATLGGRFDHIGFRVEATELWDGGVSEANQESFAVFNPSVGLQYTAAGGLRVHGSGGRAFVTPTAFQVAGQVARRAEAGVHLTRGNPDLGPESSVTWDVGVGLLRPATGLDLDATYFRTRVRDRITTHDATVEGETGADGTPILSRTTYANADAAEMEGLEWRLAYDLGALRGGRVQLRPYVGATHMLRAEETIGASDRPIRSVADLTVNFGVDLDDLRRFGTRLSGRYVGERVDDDWNVWPAAQIHYPAFLTLDWTGELRLAERFRLGVVVSNLTDENYYEVRGYPLPGRAARIRLTVDF